MPVLTVDTPLKSLTFAYETFKLETRVVLVTVIGAVPVDTLLVNVLATTPVVAFKLPADTFPETFNELNVPTDVIFGWAAVVTVPAVAALPLTEPVIVALTVKPVSVPTLVILG